MAAKRKYELRGVTPTLLVDSSDIQNNTPTVGAKFNASGKMDALAEGVCASLSSFWLSRQLAGHPVTAASDFPSAFQLSIAQGSYIMDPRGGGKDEEALMDRFGVGVVTKKTKGRKWYTFKRTKVDQVVAQAVKAPGYYYFRIVGDGGHAMAIATKNTAQFFDPNDGVFSFKTTGDLKNWVPAFIAREYSDLMERTELYGVG